MTDEPDLTWLEGLTTSNLHPETMEVDVRPRWDAPLTLDARASGWTITIRRTTGSYWHQASATLVAPPDVDVTVRIEQTQHLQDVIVDAPGATVLVADNGPTIRLITAPKEIRASAGTLTINGDAAYRLAAECPEGERLRVRGDARIVRLTGVGDVTVDGLIEPGSADESTDLLDEFTGVLRAREMRRVRVHGDDVALYVSTVLVDCDVDAREVQVHGEVQRSKITARGVVRVGSMDRSDVTQSAGDGVGVVVGAVPQMSVPSEALSEDELLGPLPWCPDPGVVSESTITAEGDVVAGDVRGSDIVSGGSLRCRSVLDERTPAGPVVVGRHLAVTMDVRRGADQSLHVPGALLVGGLLVGGEVTADRVELGAIDDARVTAERICKVGGPARGARIATDEISVADVDRCDLEGRMVSVSGAVDGGTITAIEHLAVQGPVTDAAVELRGSAELDEQFRGRLTWRPGSAQESLVVHGRPEVLDTIAPDEGQPTVELAGGGEPWPEVRVRGTIRLQWARGDQPSRPSCRMNRLVIESAPSEPGLTIDGAKVDVGELGLAGPTYIQVRLGSRLNTPVPAGSRVTFEGGGSAAVKITDATAGADEPSDVRVTVRRGAKFELASGVIDHLAFEGPASDGSSLAVAQEGVVQDLEGDLRLAQVAGRVEVSRRRRADERPVPRLHGLEQQTDEADGTGIVLGVDPTQIPFGELKQMGSFHVFEADQRSLLRWAKTDRASTYELRSAAVSAQRIAAQVKKTAASGSSRSAAMWAAAHTHAQSVPLWSAERPLRFAHRLLGYSQRPAVALATYASAVALWIVVGINLDLLSPSRRGLHQWVETVLKVALHPAAFLARVPEAGRGSDPLFVDWSWGSVAFLTLGIALVFFVVAMRNFMAPPDTDA